MKNIKTFENFSQEQDLGRFGEEEQNHPHGFPHLRELPEDEMEHEDEMEMNMDEIGSEEEMEEEECEPCNPDEEGSERNWGDQYIESFNSFFEAKKAKPDFLDLDKDGDKKESMKKAAKDAKEDKKNDKSKDKKEDKKTEEKSTKGLSAAQKKLPPALQKAILAKKKK